MTLTKDQGQIQGEGKEGHGFRFNNIRYDTIILHRYDMKKIIKTRYDMKNNMNTIRRYKYVKIIQIKKYMSKSIYFFIYNMIRRKKCKYHTNTIIITCKLVMLTTTSIKIYIIISKKQVLQQLDLGQSKSVIEPSQYSNKFELDSKFGQRSIKFHFSNSSSVRNENQATQTRLIRFDS